MDIAQVLGWIATVLFSIMVIPQMVKTIKSKDTNGVSLLLFVIFLIANIIALTYAIMISQPPLIIKYIIAIITTVAYIIIFLYYYQKKKKSQVVMVNP
ncbi:PQ-loop repeat-containing protein [Candidatus Woesearchaeota archaeon]|nr:PQ-loop repeat-containing protein [Candidatus Woesearchaeota archaeon]